ncbi:MAG: hypothetical protein EAZ08_13420 [Cytophagales bacterium]|nr:MAG: hypothetical protein EAZ08_13420 [Cytophagales bacterium]
MLPQQIYNQVIFMVSRGENPEKDWITNNIYIHTRLNKGDMYINKSFFEQEKDEILILDCLLPCQHYFFLSTKRIGSYFQNEKKSFFYAELDDFTEDCLDALEPDSLTDIYTLTTKNNDFISIEVDNGSPSRWAYAIIFLFLEREIYGYFKR